MKGCIGSPYKPVECAAKFLNQFKKNRISKSQSTINAIISDPRPSTRRVHNQCTCFSHEVACFVLGREAKGCGDFFSSLRSETKGNSLKVDSRFVERLRKNQHDDNDDHDHMCDGDNDSKTIVQFYRIFKGLLRCLLIY